MRELKVREGGIVRMSISICFYNIICHCKRLRARVIVGVVFLFAFIIFFSVCVSNCFSCIFVLGRGERGRGAVMCILTIWLSDVLSSHLSVRRGAIGCTITPVRGPPEPFRTSRDFCSSALITLN